MKKFLLALLLAGCSLSGVSYGDPTTFEVEDSVRYEDGLTVKLLSIDDSRCPVDVQCVWEGELAANFELSGGVETQEVRLGTVSGSDAKVEGYRIALTEVSESTATVTIVKTDDEN